MEETQKEEKPEIQRIDALYFVVRELDQIHKRIDKVEEVLEVVRNAIYSSEGSLKSEIEKVDNGLRSEIKKVESDLRLEIQKVESSLRSEIKELRKEFDSRFRWIIGLLLAGWITIILTLWFKH
ncbi:MAG: prominin family protein [Thermodesulfovibrionales bacterium]|nr:prominin family protein [Thermodesulfovibrionales bacterium]